MLERMFVSEEKVRLEQDRMMVAQGDSTFKLKILARFGVSDITKNIIIEHLNFCYNRFGTSSTP